MPRHLLSFFVLVLSGCVAYHPYPNQDGLKQKEGASPEDINEVLEYVERVSQERSANEEPAAPVEAPTAGDEPENEISQTIAHIPVEINDEVKGWIEYFTVKDRERFQRFLNRGEKFKPMIMQVLKDQGLPMDLYYLALIESGFSEQAVSHARAVGVWQFIKGTGKRYGLRVDGYVDERRDPMRSTIAATLYLNDLHNVFQSWYLAMAAYNAGELRIMTAIMKGNSRDFWELVKKNRLPKETMNYIPKFLAAVIIGHNPEHYGFKIEGETPHPSLVLAQVPSPIRLTDVAKTTGIGYGDLKKYNPHLVRGLTPVDAKNYRIWVPAGMQHLLKDQENHLAKLRYRAPRSTYANNGKGKYHRVRRGESLYAIAKRYKVSVHELKRMNKLASNQIFAGSLLKVSSGGSNGSYRVRRGDSLSTISRKFGIPIQQLKKINRLNRNTIYVGQVLALNNRG